MEVVAAAIVGGLVGHLISGGNTVKLGDKEIYLGQPYKDGDKGTFLRQLFDDSRKENKKEALKKLGLVGIDKKSCTHTFHSFYKKHHQFYLNLN